MAVAFARPVFTGGWLLFNLEVNREGRAFDDTRRRPRLDGGFKKSMAAYVPTWVARPLPCSLCERRSVSRERAESVY